MIGVGSGTFWTRFKILNTSLWPLEEQSRLTKELLSNCESIEWQVDELMRIRWPILRTYVAIDNDDFISSESDRQLLLIKQQDEELDELSASEKNIEELGSEMDSTSNRLDFVQKKVAVVMKCQGPNDDDLILDCPVHHFNYLCWYSLPRLIDIMSRQFQE
ncbi:hypothetical protein QVD17_09178 [Tagetes erecta]|uniref:Uncharacterized protein n=1 Tax=Tagetes erecta TaxID=13708 RepID=A0AAD8L0H4_TARER|nr:hypothetical protein QVD17_09178 [Tagetes erecta]